jgi:hypothetical protein
VVLLEAINAHAITRLALPDNTIGDVAVLGNGPSTWAEQASAVDRLRSCFVYRPDGRPPGADIELSSQDPRVLENVTATIDPLPAAVAMRDALLAHVEVTLPGPSVPADGLRWVRSVEQRVGEVPAVLRARLAAETGQLIESYRRVTVDTALAGIAGL